MATIRIGREFITAAMKSQGVRDAIEGKATELLASARAQAAVGA